MLSAGCVGEKYKIVKIECQDVGLELHLKNLGFNVGKKVCISNYNYFKQSLLVDVDDSRFAIDKKIADGIVVENE